MGGKTKIFQIGFNRCGTATMHGYLRANGIPSVHNDKGKLARHMFHNSEQGKELLSGYSRYQAFFDMEWLGPDRFLEGYKLYPQLAESYPDGIFILNTRNREAWIRSRIQHARGGYIRKHRAILGAASDDEVAEHWRQEWDAHHRNVIEFFAGKPYRFFVCNIETDLPDVLNRMLPEFALDPRRFHILHVAALRNKTEAVMTEAIMRRNNIARLRNEQGFSVALMASMWGIYFGLQSLRAYLDYHISRILKASERATRKQIRADRYLRKMIQGFKGLNGDYVTREEIGDEA
jgi:hypothetical protein